MKSIKKISVILTVMILCGISQAHAIKKVTFLNRWPYSPRDAVVADDSLPTDPVRYLFIADGDALIVLDRSTLTETGRVYVPTSEGITNIFFANDKIYAASGHQGIQIIDVSNPNAPVLEKSFGKSQDQSDSIQFDDRSSATDFIRGQVRGIWVENGKAYTASTQVTPVHPTVPTQWTPGGDTYLYVTDVSGLVATAIVGQSKVPDDKTGYRLTEARNIQISKGYAYITDIVNGIHVFSVSSVTPQFQLVSPALNQVDLDIVGDYIYSAGSLGFGLHILDISNPLSPVAIQFQPNDSGERPEYFQYKIVERTDNNGQIEKVSESDARSIDVVGNTAYIADATNGLIIINVANLENPSLVSEFNDGGNIAEAYSVLADGTSNTAFLADKTQGLQEIDISNLSAPSVNIPNTYPLDVANTHNFALFTEYDSTKGEDVLFACVLNNQQNDKAMRILRFNRISGFEDSQFDNISLESRLALDSAAEAYKVVVGSETVGQTTRYFAYIANGTEGLQIVEVTDPQSPQTLYNGNVGGELSDARSVYVLFDTLLLRTIAYIADGAGSGNGVGAVDIVDVTNKANPVHKAAINLPSAEAKDIFAEQATNGNLYAYVAAGAVGLEIIDVDPDSANYQTVIYTGATGGDAKALDVWNQKAYVASGAGGLSIFRVVPGTDYRLLGSIATTDASGVFVRLVDKLYAFVANGAAGVRVIDVENPDNPEEVTDWTIDTPGDATGIAVNAPGDIAIVADGSGGLTLQSFTDTDDLEDYVDPGSYGSSNCFIGTVFH